MALRLENLNVQGPLSLHHPASTAALSRRRPIKSEQQQQQQQQQSSDSRFVETQQSPEPEAPISLGSAPAIEPDMPFNPFLSSTPGAITSSPYELLKTLLLLPVAIVRLIAFILILLLGILLTKLALVGAKHVLTRPFPRWRRRLLLPVRLLARALLFAAGFHWITIRGSPASRSTAPIIVCNHVTFVDPVFIFFAHLPVIVTAAENLHYPLFGSIIRAMQVIAINRASDLSRRAAGGEIKRRAQCNDWSPVMIFPEATTTNGKSLVTFKTGAFTPGFPVQPMVVRYPNVHMDPSWVALGPAIYLLLFRLMSQFHNHMIVEYLPVVYPTPLEQKNPRLFTERVRMIMARALNVTVTEHCFEDLIMVMEGQKLFNDNSGIQVIEFGRFERLYKLTAREGKSFYVKYRAMDPSSSGGVGYEALLGELRLPDCPATRRVFGLFDTPGRGSFNFRQYVNGLAFISRFGKRAETIDAAYGLCDRDGDGRLSFDDVSSGLRDLIPGVREEHVGEIWRRINNGVEERSKAVVKAEFVEFLEANPEYLAVFLFARSDLLSPKSGSPTSDAFLRVDYSSSNNAGTPSRS